MVLVNDRVAAPRACLVHHRPAQMACHRGKPADSTRSSVDSRRNCAGECLARAGLAHRRTPDPASFIVQDTMATLEWPSPFHAKISCRGAAGE